LEKYQDDNYSSAGFLSQAKGPLAERYHAMVPDFHGYREMTANLLAVENETVDIRETLKAKDNPLDEWKAGVIRDWGEYRVKADGFYGFDEAQRAEAERILTAYELKLADAVDELKGWLMEKPDKVRTLIRVQSSPSAEEVPFEKQRIDTAAGEVKSEMAKLEATAKGLERDYRAMITNRVLSVADAKKTPDERAKQEAEQRAKGVPPDEPTSLARFDRVLTYCLIAGGLCLLVGLLTRVAAAGCAFFLLSVMGTQDLWISGSQTLLMHYELVEFWALVALTIIPTGRWVGLDYFLYQCCSRCCGKAENKDAPNR
jgi:uncharacterized membrane protein YphA (DoxX/SURF4 family)